VRLLGHVEGIVGADREEQRTTVIGLQRLKLLLWRDDVRQLEDSGE